MHQSFHRQLYRRPKTDLRFRVQSVKLNQSMSVIFNATVAAQGFTVVALFRCWLAGERIDGDQRP